MSQDTDVFVVGGGPAGLAAAIAAAHRGFAVTVADGSEPPIDKPCGEGMMPETQDALKRLGVELPAGIGWTFRGIRFLHGERVVSADFPSGQGIGVRRPVLHELLVRVAERCGVRLLWKTPVVGIETGGMRLRDRVIQARWIIGADGGASRMRNWAGLDGTVRRTQRMASRRHYRVRPWSEYTEIYWAQRAQAYVTPISADEICIVLVGDHAPDIKFDDALTELPRLRGRLAGAGISSRERGVVTVTQRLNRVARRNLALIGDASGGVDAITGEGLRLAFRQAAALADAMEVGDLDEYQRAHRALQRRPLWMGQLMVQLGRRESVRTRLMRVMCQHPKLFARILAIHGGSPISFEIVSTGAHLGWKLFSA